MSNGGDLIEAMERERVCVRCNAIFTERENLGLWRCRRYHPRAAAMTAHTEAYECCGGNYRSKGCVPADHSDREQESYDDVFFPPDDLERLDFDRVVTSQAWRALPAGGGVVVKRFDDKAMYNACREPRVEQRHCASSKFRAPVLR